VVGVSRFKSHRVGWANSAPRSFGEKPILASKLINNEVSADFCLSLRYAAINVAAISTRKLSALVSPEAAILHFQPS